MSTSDRAVWRVAGTPLLGSTGRGALDGESVAVKDLFAVGGFAIGAGVPAYLESAAVEPADADAVARLRAAGATIRGIAQTDQFAYALTGDNPHYGTPANAVVPAAYPGGSSSGPATAVALGEASIGLATDTAGSIRVPASYQGLWGLRTTHGAVDSSGLLPLAPDFDTIGLLTRTPELLLRAAAKLVPDDDAAGFASVDLERSGLEDDLDHVAEAFRVHQAYSAWKVHGPWITTHPDAVTGAAAERFRIASRVTADEDQAACAVLTGARTTWEQRLGDAVLRLPSAPGPAPLLTATADSVDAVRRATLRLTCVAGVTGRPAVAAPLDVTPDGPVGTSYIGPRGSDLSLIRFVQANGPA